MSILNRQRPKVKATRKTARVTAPFGCGLIRYTPEFSRWDHTAGDESWAAAELNSEPEPDWDMLAREAEWLALYEQGIAAGDRCPLCGLITDDLCEDTGLCTTCDDAAIESAIASANSAYGLERMVY